LVRFFFITCVVARILELSFFLERWRAWA
jgi:hypothetical protein